jgi:hypothetical protein
LICAAVEGLEQAGPAHVELEGLGTVELESGRSGLQAAEQLLRSPRAFEELVEAPLVGGRDGAGTSISLDPA